MFKVFTFYKFIKLQDLPELKLKLLKKCNELNIKGTILLAEEGVNSTLSGSAKATEAFVAFFESLEGFKDICFKYSESSYQPFKRMKVKIKSEIVTFKVKDLDMENKGTYLDHDMWDAMLDKSVVIDTRNTYELVFGTFENATNPKTAKFSDYPQWAAENLADVDKDTPILMCCTGGIRCEKSTAYMKQKMGFKNVYHLKGGILEYLEKSKNKNKKWTGECFVFDDRICVDENLSPIDS